MSPGDTKGVSFFFKRTQPGTPPAQTSFFLIRENFLYYLFIISRPFSPSGTPNIHRGVKRLPKPVFPLETSTSVFLIFETHFVFIA